MYLNVRAKIIKHLKEAQKKLYDLGSGKELLNITPEEGDIEKNVVNLTLLKLKTFVLQKTLLRNCKENPQRK